MNERMYQQSARNFYAREKRRRWFSQAVTVFAFLAVGIVAGTVALQVESIGPYWIVTAILALAVFAVFVSLSRELAGWGFLSVCGLFCFAALIAFLAGLFNADLGAALAVLAAAIAYGIALLFRAMQS